MEEMEEMEEGRGKKVLRKRGRQGNGWRVRKREMNQTGENGTGKK